jgi:hypothetical protein
MEEGSFNTEIAEGTEGTEVTEILLTTPRSDFTSRIASLSIMTSICGG